MRRTRPCSRTHAAAAVTAACMLVLCLATVAHASPQFVNPTGGMANSSSPLCYAHWQSIGPFAVSAGAAADSPEGMGAVTSIWTSNGVAFAGAANGGVWRTMDLSGSASYSGPLWEPMTDTMLCGSITAVAGYNASGTLVVAAACGLASSSRSGAVRAGEMSGVMLTTDGGASWAMTAFPKGYDISAIVFNGTAIGSAIVVSARGAVLPIDGATGNATNSYGTTAPDGGIWHSVDNGGTWIRSYSATPVSDLVVNPSLTNVMYASLLVTSDASLAFPALLKKSVDSGASWQDIIPTPTFMTQLLQGTCPTTTPVSLLNIRLTMTSVGETVTGKGFLGLVFYLEEGTTGCYGFLYSTDGAEAMTALFGLDDPAAAGFHANFGTATEPTGATVQWYFGGAGVQYVYPFSTQAFEAISGATGAASSSAPHANTLNLAWDAKASKLIAATEGGLYTRSVDDNNPTGAPWTALNGNLAVAQAFSAAFDPESGALAVGTSGNGVMISQLLGTTERNSGIWSFVQSSSSDGTSAGIDSSVSPAQIYSAAARLSGLSKVSLNGVGTKIDFSLGFARTSPQTACALGSSCFAYDTPLAVNSADNSLVLVCTADPAVGTQCFSVTFGNILSGGGSQVATALEFESQKASPALGTEPLTRYVFGGRKASTLNANVVFLVGKTAIWARETPCADMACVSTCTANNTCTMNGNAIIQSPPWRTTITRANPAQHPEDYYINLVIDDAGHSWLTTDFGLHWTDLNLDANSNLRTVSGHTTVDTFNTGAAVFVRTLVGGVYPLVIATSFGAFVTFDQPTASSFTFVKLGANYAHTVPSGLFYSPSVDELTLSTFGRGVWQMQSASWVLAQAQLGQSTSTTNPACLVPLYPNVVGAPGYTAGALPAPIDFPASAPAASSTAMAGESSSSSSATEQSSSSAAAESSSAAQSSSAMDSSSSAAESSSAMESSSSSAAESSSAVESSSSASLESSSSALEQSSSSAVAQSSSSVESSSALAASSSSSAVDSSSSVLSSSSSLDSSSSGAAESSSAMEASSSSSAAMESSSATDSSSSADAMGSSSAESSAQSSSVASSSSAMDSSSSSAGSSAAAESSSSAMDSSSSAVESSSATDLSSSTAMDSSSAMEQSSSSVAESSSAVQSSSAAMDSSSSSAMDSSSASLESSSSALEQSSSSAVESSSAMAASSSADSSSAGQSSSAVESSSAMESSSTAEQSSSAIEGSSSAMGSSSSSAGSSAAMESSSSAMEESSSSAATGEESSSTADSVSVESSSSAEAEPSSSTGEEPSPAESSSTGEDPVVESSTGEEPPVESSTGEDPVPSESSSTGAAVPVLVQFTLALDYNHLPNGLSVLSFTQMLLASLNNALNEFNRFEFIAFGQPHLIVQVRVLESTTAAGIPAETLATSLIALINDANSAIYAANADPILKAAMVGSANQYSVAPPLEQPDTGGPFGSINSNNGNSHRAGLIIGVIVGCVVGVVAIAACAVMHWRASQAYNARKKALYERTQELMSV